MTHEIVIDDDVKAVAEFMQTHISNASRLVPVANALAALAPAMWGQYPAATVQPLRLEARPIETPHR